MSFFKSISTVVVVINMIAVAVAHDSLHPHDHRRHHRHNTEAVFWQRIQDQLWSSAYGNPCQSGPSEYDESYDPAAMVSSLSVDDREEILRAKAGNLLSRLRHLERFVVGFLSFASHSELYS